MHRKLLEIISANFDVTRQVLTIYCAFAECLRANENTEGATHHLFTDFKKVYDSAGVKTFYNIVLEFGIHMKRVRLIQMCLTEPD